MRPLLPIAAVTTLLFGMSVFAPAGPRLVPAPTSTRSLRRPVARSSACNGVRWGTRCLPPPRCAEGELDLDGQCLPAHLDGPPPSHSGLRLVTNQHTDRFGRLVVYDLIPRRADLPTDYDAYVYPVPHHEHMVTSGFDLDLADEDQRRGPDFKAVGHGGVDLPAARGTAVRVLRLRGQIGMARVLFTGTLWGRTVVLEHRVRFAGAERTVLALHGHLEAIAPELRTGGQALQGQTLGTVGDSGADGRVHLHYETRILHAGTDSGRIRLPEGVIDPVRTAPVDPRNLLPFLGARPGLE